MYEIEDVANVPFIVTVFDKKKKIEIYTYIVAHGKLSFKAITRQQNLD